MGWKNIAPLRAIIDNLPDIKCEVEFGDCITIKSDEAHLCSNIEQDARAFMPWRKGPFKLFDTLIDSEWQSFMKFNLIRPYFDLKDKKVADIGCNNGYYLFKMLNEGAKELVGFDPSATYKSQFDFINHFVKSDIRYELLGVEHLPFYEHKFNLIFCLGVLYHRSDPVAMLKDLYRGLEDGGEVILDTFMIDGDDEVALCPKDKYSKIPNIYFVPTVNALKNWSLRAKFESFEVLHTSVTTPNEQRKTS